MEIFIAIVLIGLGAAFYYNRKSQKAATTTFEAPYKLEAPTSVVEKAPEPVAEPVAEVVNPQITDAVTQDAAPVKKTRKPRTPKAEKPAAKKPAAKKAAKVAASPKAPRKSKKA